MVGIDNCAVEVLAITEVRWSEERDIITIIFMCGPAMIMTVMMMMMLIV